jgi:predicted amidophosphoribosyltransferase
VAGLRSWCASTAGALVDLVLPARCAGCDRPGTGPICAGCVAALSALAPAPVAPVPAPPGLPPCVALGPYEGVLRGLLLAYKDDGRHRLAGPLGAHLARCVASAVLRAGHPAGTPVVLVPVPSTAAAARARHGDHMGRLARRAAQALHGRAWPAAVARPLAARPKPDSSHLDAAGRARAARDAFRIRPRQARRLGLAAATGAVVIAVDDVLTTGATMAAVAHRMAGSGLPVGGAATLTATRRRHIPRPDAPRGFRPG